MNSSRMAFSCRLNSYTTYIFLILLLFILSNKAVGEQRELILEDAVSSEHVDQYVSYYADTQGNQDLSDILINPNIFVPSDEKRFTFNVHTHWYRLRLAHPADKEEIWYVNTGVSSAPLLKAYWISDLTGEIKIVSNSRSPTIEEKKKIKFSGYIFPLNLQPHEKGTLLIEYQSMANFQLMIKLYTERGIIKRGLTLMLLTGIYIGIIAVFAVFFLSQFVIRRTRTLGYYTLFIFSLIAFIAQLNGYGLQSIWGGFKQYNSLISSFLGGSLYIWYFLFTARIFQLEEHNKKLYFVLISLCRVIVLTLILGIFIPMDYVMSVIVVFGLPWPSIIAIWAVRKDHPSAKIFLLGSFIHCAMTYLFMLGCLGISMGDNSFIFGLASVGQLIDIICFSIAIFYQQNQIRKQYHHQVELRLNDMHSLSESEQLTAKMLSLSKEKVLQTAATIHDMLQPLAAMRLLISSQDQNLPITQNIKNALAYTENLLNSVLKSSKTDYQKIHETVKVKCLIDNIAERHQGAFNEKGIHLKVHCSDIEITCLPIVINRIVDNLLANALRHTTQGKVLLSGRPRSHNRFLIQIWDTGKGIPQLQIKKILSPFKQLNTEDIENMGFGLGLFIVKSLCDDSGYQLDIRSKVGKGSCFSILVTDTNI